MQRIYSELTDEQLIISLKKSNADSRIREVLANEVDCRLADKDFQIVILKKEKEIMVLWIVLIVIFAACIIALLLKIKQP